MDEITLDSIVEASERLEGHIAKTPLEFNKWLSDIFGANIFLKREDKQPIRSYKIRGAFNRISMLSDEEIERGVVAASAGNHSQAVGYSCDYLGIDATIFMPRTTPKQKIENTARFGNGRLQLRLVGDSFDDAYAEALRFAEKNGAVFVHPFNDPKVIAGQGTIGLEILQQLNEKIDYVFVPIGGGGLISGIGTYLHHASPSTRIIGVEQIEAAAMYHSLKEGHLVKLKEFSNFIDGTAVRKVGDLTFAIAQKLGYEVLTVPEGKACTSLVELYNQGIVAELAGALPIAGLSEFGDKLKGKNIVCILSGGNNDFDRLPEIKVRSLIHEGLLYYFMIEFPQRPGALRQFLDQALGPNDDITHFQYTKRTSAEKGPALVGLQLKSRDDYEPLLNRFGKTGFKFEEVSKNTLFLRYFI